MATLVAVIEIGSTGVRLLVAEITDEHNKNILDSSELPVPIGQDVFTTGTVSRDTITQVIHHLTRFKEQLSAWGLTPQQTRTIATRAIREAKNRDPVLDRIYVKTGFRVSVIDGIENNRLTYLAVADCLKTTPVLSKGQNALILEVSGGSTDLMLIEKGRMAGAHSMRLGTVLIQQQMRTMLGSLEDARRYVEEFISNTKGSLNNELDFKKIKQFIAVSTETRIAAIHAGRPISTFLWEIKRNDFEIFIDTIQNYSIEECVARFKISYSDAQSLHISLLIYQLFLKLTNVERLLVAETSIREGLVIEQMAAPDTSLLQNFHKQITASAMNHLRKYRGDERHAEYVRKISVTLFNALQSEIALDDRARMLLEVAAILHDIGIFIALDNHNLHSSYIIQNSEIFGLSPEDITIVSQIAYYHRGTHNPQDDIQFTVLPRDTRMIILKLTAILRIADALDRSHQQRIKNCTVRLYKDTMTIHTEGNHRFVLEKQALAQKGDMFEAIFGYKLIIM
ncbi:MAG: HD domain-containing protein [Treponema sp.]|nr:HD domain-containing protein [Treponema sp.]